MASRIQGRLFTLAVLFLSLYALILTLSPAVWERSWAVDYHWSHWLGLGIWAILFWFAHWQISRHLPECDPYLLPIAALLSGWGLLTIWRLTPSLGMRQAVWLGVSVAILIFGSRLPADLGVLRRHKYILLSSGLLLTALTLIFGSNPSGFGLPLWLGCCGIYLQPSEPLKLLLIAYLAAYFTDHPLVYQRILPFIFPTLLLTGFALLLLLVQRDLGTAVIFILLYAVMLYLAVGHKRFLLISGGALVMAGLVGYFSISIVRVRIDTWLNPWLDPSGRSYQIIQSLLAIANGATLGRGPGLGSPTLIPIAHSDFIFSAIGEETGLIGTSALLVLLFLLITRGLHTALNAPDRFCRLLSAGIAAYLGVQSILIIAGNLRLLPLTGVTLPFISYGGSSLLTSFVSLLFLLMIGSHPESEPTAITKSESYYLLAGALGLALFALALTNGWWGIIRGPDLLTRIDNPRRSITDRYVLRGSLLDRNDIPINTTQGKTGNYQRLYLYPELTPVIGYTHSAYGQAGLEASLDDYLRGLQGNPASLIWWHHLLYGQPPPGLDIRLSLDLTLQEQADLLLGDHMGTVVMLNAQNGEVLVMASHPNFNPQKLDEESPELTQDLHAPLLNRAAQGSYQSGTALNPFLIAAYGTTNIYDETELRRLYSLLGFYTAPALRLPVTLPSPNGETKNLHLNPIQMVLATAALSNGGLRPPARLALAVKTPQQGWVILPALSDPVQALSGEAADATAQALMVTDQPFWQSLGRAYQEKEIITWYLAGTLPGWQGTPLALVVLLEENNPTLGRIIGQNLLKITLTP